MANPGAVKGDRSEHPNATSPSTESSSQRQSSTEVPASGPQNFASSTSSRSAKPGSVTTRSAQHNDVDLESLTAAIPKALRLSDTTTHHTHTPSRNKRKPLSIPPTPPLTPPLSTSDHHQQLQPNPMSRPVRLLLASLGNPPPYHSTRHSAGHIILRALASHLSFPPLSTKPSNTNLTTSSTHPNYTLHLSPSTMNVCGPGLAKVWKTFDHTHRDAVTALVILHDELESAPGTIKVRRGGSSSTKGHNGLKSVQNSLSGGGVLGSLGEESFVKIGVGIGRPVSREREDVSSWVLGQVTREERGRIEGGVGEVLGILEGVVGQLGRG